ncbi:reverse transcriptase domain-containing protein [Tanacetum coccineum]
MDVCHALADLGASINVMPLSICKKLSLPELTPTRMTLELADRSIIRPKGLAEDVFVKVGKFHFPTDFVAVDFEADPWVPLILGRSFLRTGRALIDVYGEEITLRVNDEAVTFNLDKTTRYSSTYDDMSINRIDVIDNACEEYSKEVLGFSNNSSGGNPTMTFEPIISDSFLSITPFKESDFILEEIEAFLKDDSISSEIDHADCDPEGDIFLIEKLLNNDPFQLPLMDLKEVIKAKSSIEEPLKLELKDLPSHLEYAYLEDPKDTEYILSNSLKEFMVSTQLGCTKGYERFQSLLSQLEIHGAGVSTEDANQKFLRSLPSAWFTFFENDVKSSTASSSNLPNVAFVSENTSSTNDVSTAYGVPITSGHNTKHEQTSTSTSSYSLLASHSSCPQLDHEDLDQVDEYDLEEMDLKWQVAMISMRIKKFYNKTGRKLQFDAKEPVGFDKTKVECYNCHKTGHFARECRSKEENRRRDGWNTGNRDGNRTGKKEESKALVTVDGERIDWTTHSKDDDDYALMANNNSGSDIQVYSCSNECKESYANLKRLYDAQREELSNASVEIKAYTQGLKKVEAQLVAHQQGQLWHMTGNKAYLADYQDINGGPVAFGGSRGYITGRCMMAIFHDMIEKTMEVFMDDFSVFGDSFDSCLSNLEKMLKRCEDTNLVLNWEKCHFMCREGIVLGHKNSKSGVEVDRAKVDVIAKLPHLTTVKEVRSFLGYAGFYRRFIQDFSKIARTKTHLLEKETPFVFSKDCIDSFETLKKSLPKL